MARYRKVETRIWSDEKFRNFSDDAQLLFFFLLTHPHMTSLGAMRATLPGLAAEKRWAEKRFNKAFMEPLGKGMVKHNERAAFVWLPNFLKYNPPDNPNVVKSLGVALEFLPECGLKEELIQHTKKFVEGLSIPFQKALPVPFRNGMPIQEQEQEQEQEKNPLNPPNSFSENSKSKPKPKISAEAESVLGYLNQTTGHDYRDASQIQTLLNQTDATPEECCLVVDWLHIWRRTHDAEWVQQYLDNATPFRPANFDKFRAKAEAWDGNGRADGKPAGQAGSACRHLGKVPIAFDEDGNKIWECTQCHEKVEA